MAGNLGAGVFSRFRVIIDWGREQMHVEPGADWNTRPFRKDRIGISGVRDGDAIKVTHVAANSPAEKRGWSAGRRIVAVNGKPVSARSWRADFMQVTRAPCGAEVELLEEGGRASKIVAADYY
jgi:predicted metalloprotease with PDZ domain